MVEVFNTILGNTDLSGVFTFIFCIVFLLYVLVRVGVIIFRIISKIINFAKSRKSLSKSESENLFTEDFDELETIIDNIKIKGK